MKKTGLIAKILFVTLLLSACGKQKSETLIIDNFTIIAEGPLFEGANTAQGEILNRLDVFAKEHDIDPSAIQHAHLKKFTLNVPDTSNFDLFSSIKILFASDESDMVEAASINTIPAGSKSLELTIAKEHKDLLKTLRQDKFTVVADAIITKDSNANINLNGSMEIELKYKN